MAIIIPVTTKLALLTVTLAILTKEAMVLGNYTLAKEEVVEVSDWAKKTTEKAEEKAKKASGSWIGWARDKVQQHLGMNHKEEEEEEPNNAGSESDHGNPREADDQVQQVIDDASQCYSGKAEIIKGDCCPIKSEENKAADAMERAYITASEAVDALKSAKGTATKQQVERAKLKAEEKIREASETAAHDDDEDHGSSSSSSSADAAKWAEKDISSSGEKISMYEEMELTMKRAGIAKEQMDRSEAATGAADDHRRKDHDEL